MRCTHRRRDWEELQRHRRDPNITGTFSTPYAHGGVNVQRTCFLDLTEASHGNALGTGLASCISKRLFDKIDLQMMYPNTITNTVIRSAELPIIMATDKESIQFCIRTLNGLIRYMPVSSGFPTVSISEPSCFPKPIMLMSQKANMKDWKP